MKIRIMSDLHCEGWDFKYEPAGEDALLLAGDIHTRDRHLGLINQLPPEVKIIMVAGNHEYYHGCFEDVNKYLLGLQDTFHNFVFLNNSSTIIDDLHIFGGTMFTDYSLHGIAEQWFAAKQADQGITDFHHISKQDHLHYNVRQWNTQDHVEQHEIFVRELGAWLKQTEGKKRLVMSHFIPSHQGVHQKYRNSALNPYFAVDMESFMGWEGHWVNGHGHDSFDYMVGDTRVISNPRGYGRENPQFNPNLIIEV